jgi:hypothetical protein
MTRDTRVAICSALLYTLAFNLTFFVQELFLVLPKAFTPGLRPTLFHNNHSWQGEHPLASLFQGTGALAIFLTGLGCALLLRRASARSATAHLFLIWVAYNGFFQSLPQVVIGAFNPRNDVCVDPPAGVPPGPERRHSVLLRVVSHKSAARYMYRRRGAL